MARKYAGSRWRARWLSTGVRRWPAGRASRAVPRLRALGTPGVPPRTRLGLGRAHARDRGRCRPRDDSGGATPTPVPVPALRRPAAVPLPGPARLREDMRRAPEQQPHADERGNFSAWAVCGCVSLPRLQNKCFTLIFTLLPSAWLGEPKDPPPPDSPQKIRWTDRDSARPSKESKGRGRTHITPTLQR